MPVQCSDRIISDYFFRTALSVEKIWLCYMDLQSSLALELHAWKIAPLLFFNIPNNMAKIGHTKYKGLQFKASEDIIYIFTFDMVPFLLAIILLCFFVKWLNLVIKCILCAQDSYVGI